MDEGLVLEYAQTVKDMVMDALDENDIDARRGIYA